MPLKFSKVLIADERFESAAFIDVNNNGILDIASGEWWYEGPDYKVRHRIGTIIPEGEYFDDFSTIAMDINGNGLPDFVTGGWWGENLRWRENPSNPEKEWKEHVICETGNVETTRAWDIDGDGELEIIPNTPCSNDVKILKLIKDQDGKGTGEFKVHVIQLAEGQTQGHGLGCGDITGNGRLDIILCNGWLEAPEDIYNDKWKWHAEFDLGSASIPILVVDVNNNGLNDLIVGQSHAYGLDWWEQTIVDGKRNWIKHPIDPFNSQYHDMKWIDIDGDGESELLTGKRYRAHCGNDPGSTDDVGIYYFKWTGENFVKQIIDFGPAREGTGLGIYFDTADITGNGLPDILAPGKDGLYLFYNEGLLS